MSNIQNKSAYGLFYSRDEAESTIRELKEAGYNMDQVSVIAKNADQVAGYDTTAGVGNKADEGATTGAVTGGTLGGLTGLLVGLGTLAIPGIGPILLAGAGATALATTLAGAGIGAVAGGLVGALAGLGIPEERAKIYSDRVKSGSYLVMVSGTASEVDHAASIMKRHGVEELDIYDAPASATTTATRATNTVVDTPTTRRAIDTPVTTTTTTTSTNTVNPNVKVDTDVENIKLYEERLVVDKERAKVGEVGVSKRVETDTAEVAVPIQKERIVIERKNVSNQSVVDPNTVAFGEGEVVRMEAYEESANIQKQAFLREEVSIRKEVEQETVQTSETIRREELDIDSDGDVIQQ
ncbi:multi-sensor signal transduction histidine kinase [Chondrocystis sp. NIES-4102]|nr:multi-sensor signal transduction histidine kinase [Chondrocystis sp. NIES-4102]